ILAILPTWRKYARTVEKIAGTSPQVSPAFSQAYCCWRFALVQKLGNGVDAFKLNATGGVSHAIEIKATSTLEGRNDIKIYPQNVTMTKSERSVVVPNPPSIEIKFAELYWLSFSDRKDRKLAACSIYKVLPSEI